MARDPYDVHAEVLKTAGDFEVLILTLPESELDDKLTALTTQRGSITRSFYEDFIIANCVANINQLLSYITNNSPGTAALLEIRAELVEKILVHNPELGPDNLVINRNYVVKVMRTKKPRPDEKLLTENSQWEKSYYEGAGSLEAKEDLKDEVKKKSSEKTKDIEDLEAEIKSVWWRRIGQYVKIKKFREEDAESILRKRYFHNPTSFNTFIVSVCVVDFEELFMLLDNMGIPTRIAPPILMNELFELCKTTNPFLTYENAQKLSGREPEDEASIDPSRPYRTTAAGPMSQYGKSKTKKKFKDVPKETLLKLSDSMKVFLIGQDEAIDTMTDAIHRARIGLKDPNRPIGSFLFAGRTGVGKTLATKVLADELIDGRDNLITIDCSEYSADHEYAKLIGSPAGYIGYENGGHLTNSVMKNPFCVVVFDEVEKASSKVHELMLQILEEARLTDNKGNQVSFKDAIVIMTSNVGAKEIESISKTIGFGDVSRITDKKKDVALNEALKKKFKPEFLNRIDSIVNFKTLAKEDYMKIIDIELYKLNDNLKHNDTDYKDMVLEFDKSIKNFIFKKGIDEDYGARPLKRCIEREIATPLAKKILEDGVANDSVVNVSSKRGKVVFDVSNAVEDIPFYLENGSTKELEVLNV